jgi:hypothetical protein
VKRWSSVPIVASLLPEAQGSSGVGAPVGRGSSWRAWAAATASARLRTPSLRNSRCCRFSTVLVEMPSALAVCLTDSPRSIEARICRSLIVSPGGRRPVGQPQPQGVQQRADQAGSTMAWPSATSSTVSSSRAGGHTRGWLIEDTGCAGRGGAAGSKPALVPATADDKPPSNHSTFGP